MRKILVIQNIQIPIYFNYNWNNITLIIFDFVINYNKVKYSCVYNNGCH